MTSLKICLQENEVERQQRWNDKDNGNGIDMPEKHEREDRTCEIRETGKEDELTEMDSNCMIAHV